MAKKFDFRKYIDDKILLHLGPLFSFSITFILILVGYFFIDEKVILTYFTSAASILVLIQQYFRIIVLNEKTDLSKWFIIILVLLLIGCYIVALLKISSDNNQMSVGLFGFYILMIVFLLDVVSGKDFKRIVYDGGFKHILWIIVVVFISFLTFLPVFEYLYPFNAFYIITSLFMMFFGWVYGNILYKRRKK